MDGRAGQREKGRATREALLDAAIALIAGRGLEAVTHREVAAAAGVALGQTTYHFASKEDLIASAFERFVARGAPGVAALWERAEAALAEGEPGLAERLAGLVTDYVYGAPAGAREGVAFEIAFLLAARLPPRLASLVRSYQAGLVERAEAFCEAMGSPCAETDARLLTGLVLRLEFERLSAATAPSREQGHAQALRVLRMIPAPR